MPRSLSLTCDRYMTDKVQPGNRVKLMGVFSTIGKREGANSNNQVRTKVKMSYLRVMGIQSSSHEHGDSNVGYALPTISKEDEEKIIEMAKHPLIFKKVSESIANTIYGHDDIKKAIACLLFGGSSKKLPDGMKLRGDVNILLLGDPSTAKS